MRTLKFALMGAILATSAVSGSVSANPAIPEKNPKIEKVEYTCHTRGNGKTVLRKDVYYTSGSGYYEWTNTSCGSDPKPVQKPTRLIPDSMKQDVWKPGMMLLVCLPDNTVLAYQPAGTTYYDPSSAGRCVSDKSAIKMSLALNKQ